MNRDWATATRPDHGVGGLDRPGCVGKQFRRLLPLAADLELLDLGEVQRGQDQPARGLMRR